MNIIAIDIGASFLKGALFKENKLIKKSFRRSPDRPIVPDVLIQLSPLISNIYDLLYELSPENGKAVLAISNEMHGFVLCDENGFPRTEYISWQKEFGGERLKDGTTAVERFAKYSNEIRNTGMPFRKSLPSANLRYFIEKVGRRVNHFYTMGDFVIRSLSGKEPYCHATNAAATGLYDICAGDWNRTLINAAGAEKIQFPEIGSKTIDFKLGDLELTALPAIGDQQATLIGAGLKNKSDISFNLGTGAQVSRLTDDLDFSDRWQIRPYFNGRYLKTVPHLPSGRAVNVFFRLIREAALRFAPNVSDDEIWSYILKAVGGADGSAMKCDLSFFENPITDHEKGSITDIGEYDLNVGNLFKTVFEQMVDNFISAADMLSFDSTKIIRVVLSGGIADKIDAVRNRIMDNYRDAEFIRSEDESLCGLAMYAMKELR